MQPTSTTTEMWQWQCGRCRSGWKMLRQVTTCCPHGGGGGGGGGGRGPLPPSPSSAGNPAPHCHCHHHRHHHYHRQEEVQGGTTTRRALAAAGAGEGSNAADAGRHTTTTITTPNPAPSPVVVAAELCWVPDAYLMVQQLREFESLQNDELVALRVQLQEYADEIHRSITNAGTARNMNWLLDLPANVRDVVVMARDVVESFIAISTSAPPSAK